MIAVVLVTVSFLVTQHVAMRASSEVEGRVLANIEHIAPKGRVQDELYNPLLQPLIKRIVSNWEEEIPILIEQITNEAPARKQVKDYWIDTRIGDLAFIMLSNLFIDSTWTRATLPELNQPDFFGIPSELTSKELRVLRMSNVNCSASSECALRYFILTHGRDYLKDKWRFLWDKYSDGIHWNDSEHCFDLN